MRKWIGIAVIWTVTIVAAGLWAHAQSNPRVDEIPTIISGNDIGFRLEGWNKDGTPIGRIVVHQEGKWVDVTLSGRVRPLSSK
jgi:hypothetical protein